MNDVAKLAGVSLKTVSRVVNGEPGVSTELIERVETAAAQLDYRPNFTASNLRRSQGTTRTVGLLLENVANPFSAALLRAIEDYARTRGSAVLSASVGEDASREVSLAQAFLARQVDGLIIAPSADSQAYLAREVARGTAMVFVDRPPVNLDADTVSSENLEGSRAAVRHLLGRGHLQRVARPASHGRAARAARVPSARPRCVQAVTGSPLGRWLRGCVARRRRGPPRPCP